MQILGLFVSNAYLREELEGLELMSVKYLV